MSARGMLAAVLMVLAGGFWFYWHLIIKDSEDTEKSGLFSQKERWTGMGQLMASGLGMTLLIPPSAVTSWGWAPALAAAAVGGMLLGAMQNLALSRCLAEKTAEKTAAANGGKPAGGWKRRSAAAAVWLFAILAASAVGHTAAASFGGFVETESGEVLRNSVGAAGAAACVILCVGAAGLGIVSRYRNISRPVKLAAVCLIILDSAWLGKTYPIYLDQMVWLAGIFLFGLFSVLIPAWVQTRPRGQILMALSVIVLGAGCLGVFRGDPRPEMDIFSLPDSGAAGLGAFFSILLWGVVSGFDSAALAVSPLRYRSSSDFQRAAVGAGMLKSLGAILALLMSFALFRPEAAAMGLEEAPQFFAASAADLLTRVGIPYDFTIALFLLAACSFLLAALDTAVRVGTMAFREMTRRLDETSARGQAGWGLGAAATLLPAFGMAILAEHWSARIFAAASFAAVMMLLVWCGTVLGGRKRTGRMAGSGVVILLAGAVISWLLPGL